MLNIVSDMFVLYIFLFIMQVVKVICYIIDGKKNLIKQDNLCVNGKYFFYINFKLGQVDDGYILNKSSCSCGQ